MIEELRNDIIELEEEITQWLGEIDLLVDAVENAREQIVEKEAEIERLQNEAARNNVLETLTNALSDMSLEDLDP